MHILLDIDGTIGTRNTRRFLELCNKRLKLNMDPERVNQLRYSEFFTQPEVLACKERLGEEKFTLALEWTRLDPRHLLAIIPMPGALTGAAKLTAFGELAYYTARKTPGSGELQHRINTQLERATLRWLRKQNFPNPEAAIFCEGPEEKLLHIADLIKQTAQPVLLVDDMWKLLLAAAADLDTATYQLLKQSLTLCAFGAHEVPEQCDIQTIALYRWSEVTSLISLLDKEEITHGRHRQRT